MLGDVLTEPPGAFVLGVGVASAATAEEVVSLAQRALDAAGTAWREVAAVATVESRRHHPAIAALGLPVVAFPPAVLHRAAPDPRPAGGLSQAPTDSRPAGGHPPVAEAAALLAAGDGAVLVARKRKSARVTVAVARAAPRVAGGPPRDEWEPRNPSAGGPAPQRSAPMPEPDTLGELHPDFSDPGADPTAWEDATKALEAAEVYWLTSVRPDGRPHTTPLIGLWHDGAAWFCTGPAERKARNLAANAHVTMTTGANSLGDGLDLVVEGDAVRVTDEAALARVADLFVAEYGEAWRFQVVDGAFETPENPGPAHVFRVTPTKVFAFAKGSPFGQTRFTFR